MRTLILGAGGVVGRHLSGALRNAGCMVVATDRNEVPPVETKVANVLFVGNVDVRDDEAVDKLIREHACPDTTVWNLAAPLSIETARSPDIAEAVTVHGMANVLNAMQNVGCQRICFTDSIGSFGAAAPRNGAKVSWLAENPDVDPGSDYGRQKKKCRELLADFAGAGGDARFAVLPGVIHTQQMWGNGTTEYVLDAILAASMGKKFVCPIDPDVKLPMIFIDDLLRGLVSLQFAHVDTLVQPQKGYTIPGVSFTANQLFEEIRRHVPQFTTALEINPDMDAFAKAWPDSIDGQDAFRDLGYSPLISLSQMVSTVVKCHFARILKNKQLFTADEEISSYTACAIGNIS